MTRIAWSIPVDSRAALRNSRHRRRLPRLREAHSGRCGGRRDAARARSSPPLRHEHDGPDAATSPPASGGSASTCARRSCRPRPRRRSRAERAARPRAHDVLGGQGRRRARPRGRGRGRRARRRRGRRRGDEPRLQLHEPRAFAELHSGRTSAAAQEPLVADVHRPCSTRARSWPASSTPPAWRPSSSASRAPSTSRRRSRRSRPSRLTWGRRRRHRGRHRRGQGFGRTALDARSSGRTTSSVRDRARSSPSVQLAELEVAGGRCRMGHRSHRDRASGAMGRYRRSPPAVWEAERCTATRGPTRRSTTRRASPARRPSARRSASASQGLRLAGGGGDRRQAEAVVQLSGRLEGVARLGVSGVDLSMTHSKELASAVAVVSSAWSLSRSGRGDERPRRSRRA